MANGEERAPGERPDRERKIDGPMPWTPPGGPDPIRKMPPLDRPGGDDDQGFGPGIQPPTTDKPKGRD